MKLLWRRGYKRAETKTANVMCGEVVWDEMLMLLCLMFVNLKIGMYESKLVMFVL